MDRVRTAPSVNASRQALAKAAHFDTVFIVEDLGLYQSEGGISGMFLFFLSIRFHFKSNLFSF